MIRDRSAAETKEQPREVLRSVPGRNTCLEQIGGNSLSVSGQSSMHIPDGSRLRNILSDSWLGSEGNSVGVSVGNTLISRVFLGNSHRNTKSVPNEATTAVSIRNTRYSSWDLADRGPDIADKRSCFRAKHFTCL